MQRRSLRLLSLLLTIGLLAGAWYGVAHSNDIFDWWRLRNYTPPAAVAQLASDTTMTAPARRLFYVYYPRLDDRAAFNQHCTTSEHSIVLGCYAGSRGIFLYNVEDPRLQGVQQVTAAHEMLHAAYDRLSSGERQRIDALTSQAFAATDDQRIKDTVEQYRSRDASVVPNELHSILGTEAHSLPPELEQYYTRYFINRAQVVAFSDKYEAEFTNRKNQIAAYDAQLKALKAEVEAAEDTIKAHGDNLTSERRRLDGLLAARRYDEYNASVDGFNARVRAYNALVRSTQEKINQYNDIVTTRNAIALEEQDLVKSLDSRLQTQATQ